MLHRRNIRVKSARLITIASTKMGISNRKLLHLPEVAQLPQPPPAGCRLQLLRKSFLQAPLVEALVKAPPHHSQMKSEV